jgi:Uncharacterized MobA-related protein
MKMFKIAAIALACGLSRRMGSKNKLLMPFEGRRLFEYTLDQIAAVDFSEKIVVANERQIHQYAQKRGFLTVQNKEASTGRASSLQAGIFSAVEADAYMFFNCDQPLLRGITIKSLLAAFERTNKIIVPKIFDRYGSPCIFPSRFREELLALAGDKGGKIVYKKYPKEVEVVKFDDRTDFMDIDIEEDFSVVLEQNNLRGKNL